jgi:hypothetical protein
LGHAEISTGSPRLFHCVTQGFSWVTQPTLALTPFTRFAVNFGFPIPAMARDFGDLHLPGSAFIPIHHDSSRGMALEYPAIR